MRAQFFARASFALAVLALGACGSEPELSSDGVPSNRCPQYACERFRESATCDRDGHCVNNACIPYTMTVTLPQTSPYAPGLTIGVSEAELRDSVGLCTVGIGRVRLGALRPFVGSFSITPQVARTVGWYLGDDRERTNTSLPAHVTLRPLDPDDAAGRRLARETGLPLEVFVLDPTTRFLLNPARPGPGLSAPLGYQAFLPPGRYERVIRPDPPFSRVFPPIVDRITVQGQGLADPLLVESVDLPDTRTFKVFGASIPLDGFVAELRDARYDRRISARAMLSGAVSEFVLHTIGFESLGAAVGGDPNDAFPVELVVVPPSDRPELPELVTPDVALGVRTVTYPVLPRPTRVNVQAVGPDTTTGVRARLLVTSGVDSDGPAQLVSSIPNALLRFRRVFTTDSSGGAALVLPPGVFDVVVMPEAGSLAALRAIQLQVPETPDAFDAPKIVLPAKPTFVGRVEADDGRPFARAVVEAAPAAELVRQGNAALGLGGVATTETAQDGTFRLPVDPGTYDITVRPADRTHFPWVVVTGQAASSGETVVEGLEKASPIRVPAPIHVSAVLAQPSGAPLPDALIRVFAAPTNKTVAVEIARARTNAQGVYHLYFAGRPR